MFTLTESWILRYSLASRVQNVSAAQRRFTAWITLVRTRVEAFLKARKANAKTAANVSTATGDKRRFGGQARALWKLFSYPFFVNPREHAHGKKGAHPGIFPFFQLLHFSVNDVRDHRIRCISLAWISNICIERENKHERLSRSINASCVHRVLRAVFEM